MKSLFSRSQFLLAAALCLCGATGCTTVVNNTTPGAVVYVRGELQANLDKRFEVVTKAANRALTDLQFSSIEEKKDALVALLDARTAEDVRIHIKVERTSDTLTTVRIRAGLIGNEKLAYAVFNKLKENL